MAGADWLLTAFRGTTWTMAGYGGSQLLRLASMVILARHLLGPKAYGLVALTNVFITGLTMLTDMGIGTDVIQHRRGDDPVFVNTAFLIGAGRGAILWVLASLLAYPFASFYRQPAVVPLAMVAASSVLFMGFNSGSVYTLTRHVQLGGLTILRLVAEATGLGVSIVWALASPTAWALVAGRVAADFVFAAGTHFIGVQRMSLEWDTQAAREILAFGAGMFASTATYFLAGEAERLVVGKFVDLVALGCFSLALSITAAATGPFQRLLAQVFYPMIASAARADEEAAARQFRKGRILVLAASGCVALAFIIGGKWIVALLLGPKYVMAGWILQLLGFRGAWEVYSTAPTQMLFALGKSRYAAFGNLSRLCFLAVGLTVAFTRFGFREAVWVLAMGPLVTYFSVLVGLARHLRTVLRSEVVCALALLTAAILAGVVASLLSASVGVRL
jgi:O-antigen/teichoic acid export membrane protein